MKKLRLPTVKELAWFGIALSLSILIISTIATILLWNTIRTRVLYEHTMPIFISGIWLGVCSILVLKLKKLSKILYLISLLINIYIFLKYMAFLDKAKYFSVSWSLMYNVSNLLEFVFFPLLILNCLTFITSIFIFVRAKAKKIN